MAPIGYLIDFCLQTYLFIIVAQAAITWLVAFDVLKIKNPQAKNLVMVLERCTEPLYSRLRKFVPPLGGIDVTPIIIIFGIYILRSLVAKIFFSL
jgi:YggT family protein